MDGTDGSAPVRGVRVSASFFDTLGLRPILGRAFGPEDEVPGQHRVLVISQAMWRPASVAARTSSATPSASAASRT